MHLSIKRQKIYTIYIYVVLCIYNCNCLVTTGFILVLNRFLISLSGGVYSSIVVVVVVGVVVLEYIVVEIIQVSSSSR